MDVAAFRFWKLFGLKGVKIKRKRGAFLRSTFVAYCE
jgi:hypothetical protein